MKNDNIVSFPPKHLDYEPPKSDAFKKALDAVGPEKKEHAQLRVMRGEILVYNIAANISAALMQINQAALALSQIDAKEYAHVAREFEYVGQQFVTALHELGDSFKEPTPPTDFAA